MNPVAQPPVGVGVQPNVAHQQQPNPQAAQAQINKAREGVTTHQAVQNFSGFDRISITSIKGEFDHADPTTVKAGVHEDESGAKYFKFNVSWTANVVNKDNSQETKEVTFNQTIYTNVEVPKNPSPLAFQSAKDQAYNVAKSYELLQHNLVKPTEDSRPEDYKTQMQAVKNNNLIFFEKTRENSEQPVGSLMAGHHIAKMEPRTLQGISLSYFSDRVSNVGQEAISRTFERRNIILDSEANTPLSAFEKMEKGAIPAAKAQGDRSGYISFLQEKLQMHSQAFGENQININKQIKKVKELSGTDEVNTLKNQYLQLKSQSAAKPVTAGTSPIPLNPSEVKQSQDRNRALSQLEKDIFNKVGIPKLEADLIQLEKEYNSFKNAQKSLGNEGSTEGDDLTHQKQMKVKKEQVEKSILDLKATLLKPSLSENVPEVPPVQANHPGGRPQAPLPVTAPGVPQIGVVLEEENIKKAKSLSSKITDFFSFGSSKPNTTATTETNDAVSLNPPQSQHIPSAEETGIKTQLKILMRKQNQNAEIGSVTQLSLEQAENKLKELLTLEIVQQLSTNQKNINLDGSKNVIKNYSVDVLSYVNGNLTDESLNPTQYTTLQDVFDKQKEKLKENMKRDYDNLPLNFDSMHFNQLVELNNKKSM